MNVEELTFYQSEYLCLNRADKNTVFVLKTSLVSLAKKCYLYKTKTKTKDLPEIISSKKASTLNIEALNRFNADFLTTVGNNR